MFIHRQKRTMKITNCSFKLGCIQKVNDFLCHFKLSASGVKYCCISTLCFWCSCSGKGTSIFSDLFLYCGPRD